MTDPNSPGSGKAEQGLDKRSEKVRRDGPNAAADTGFLTQYVLTGCLRDQGHEGIRWPAWQWINKSGTAMVEPVVS